MTFLALTPVRGVTRPPLMFSEVYGRNIEKVSLGQMLNFLFSDHVSIFNIASVNP